MTLSPNLNIFSFFSKILLALSMKLMKLSSFSQFGVWRKCQSKFGERAEYLSIWIQFGSFSEFKAIGLFLKIYYKVSNSFSRCRSFQFLFFIGINFKLKMKLSTLPQSWLSFVTLHMILCSHCIAEKGWGRCMTQCFLLYLSPGCCAFLERVEIGSREITVQKQHSAYQKHSPLPINKGRHSTDTWPTPWHLDIVPTPQRLQNMPFIAHGVAWPSAGLGHVFFVMSVQ